MGKVTCCRSGSWFRDGCFLAGAKENDEGKRDAGKSCTFGIPGVLGLAIFIIGCLGAGGVMTTGAMAGAVVGIGAAATACILINGGFGAASTWIGIAIFVTVIALGSIAMTTNMLSGAQLGYGLFSTALAGWFVRLMGAYCDAIIARKELGLE